MSTDFEMPDVKSEENNTSLVELQMKDIEMSSTTSQPQKDTNMSLMTSNSTLTSGIVPGYSMEGEKICCWRKVGFGRQFIVKNKSGSYDLRSGKELGLLAAELYNCPAQDQLGQHDDEYSKANISTYKGLKGVASKPLKTRNADRTKPPTKPDTYGLMEFYDKEVWLSRTVIRRILGRKDADVTIANYYINRGEELMENRPPKKWVSYSNDNKNQFPTEIPDKILQQLQWQKLKIKEQEHEILMQQAKIAELLSEIEL